MTTNNEVKLPELPQEVACRSFGIMKNGIEGWRFATHRSTYHDDPNQQMLYTADQMYAFYEAGLAAGRGQSLAQPAPHTDIKEMVSRFLSWKLPKNFSPDAGITFNRQGTDYERGYPWPTGTNLLDATQATEMFEYCAQHPAQAAVSEGWKLARKALEYSLKVQNFAQHVHTARQDRELATMETILRKLTEAALKQLP